MKHIDLLKSSIQSLDNAVAYPATLPIGDENREYRVGPFLFACWLSQYPNTVFDLVFRAKIDVPVFTAGDQPITILFGREEDRDCFVEFRDYVIDMIGNETDLIPALPRTGSRTIHMVEHSLVTMDEFFDTYKWIYHNCAKPVWFVTNTSLAFNDEADAVAFRLVFS